MRGAFVRLVWVAIMCTAPQLAAAAEGDFRAQASRKALRAEEELSVRVQRDGSGADCAVEVRFGDGTTRALRLESGKSEAIATHQYVKPGNYHVEVVSKAMVRGLRTAFGCPGSDQSIQVQVRDATDAAGPAAQSAPGAASGDRGLGPAAAPPTAQAAPGRRVALVIGNSQYQTISALLNPVRDGKRVAEVLRSKLQFEVEEAYDVRHADFIELVERLRVRSRGADAVVFYFAGHGISDRHGANYLLPVDARVLGETTLSSSGLPADAVVDSVSRGSPRVALVLLDACRSLPLFGDGANSRARQSLPRGLAAMRLPSSGSGELLVQFATQPGDVAQDGSGSNSPYALALATQLEMASHNDMARLAQNVKEQVLRATANAQAPAVFAHNLGPDTYLVTPAAPGRPIVPSLSAMGPDESRWAAIQNSSKSSDFEAFVLEFPKSRYAPMAAGRLKSLAEQGALAEQQRDVRAWIEVEKVGTPQAYQLYLQQFPNGAYASVARQKLASTARPSQTASTPSAQASGPAPAIGAALIAALMNMGNKNAGTRPMVSAPTTTTGAPPSNQQAAPAGSYNVVCSAGAAPLPRVSNPVNFGQWACKAGNTVSEPLGSCPGAPDWGGVWPNVWRVTGGQAQQVGRCF